jgi:hypothetical protein
MAIVMAIAVPASAESAAIAHPLKDEEMVGRYEVTVSGATISCPHIALSERRRVVYWMQPPADMEHQTAPDEEVPMDEREPVDSKPRGVPIERHQVGNDYSIMLRGTLLCENVSGTGKSNLLVCDLFNPAQ